MSCVGTFAMTLQNRWTLSQNLLGPNFSIFSLTALALVRGGPSCNEQHGGSTITQPSSQLRLVLFQGFYSPLIEENYMLCWQHFLGLLFTDVVSMSGLTHCMCTVDSRRDLLVIALLRMSRTLIFGFRLSRCLMILWVQHARPLGFLRIWMYTNVSRLWKNGLRWAMELQTILLFAKTWQDLLDWLSCQLGSNSGMTERADLSPRWDSCTLPFLLSLMPSRVLLFAFLWLHQVRMTVRELCIVFLMFFAQMRIPVFLYKPWGIHLLFIMVWFPGSETMMTLGLLRRLSAFWKSLLPCVWILSFSSLFAMHRRRNGNLKIQVIFLKDQHWLSTFKSHRSLCVFLYSIGVSQVPLRLGSIAHTWALHILCKASTCALAQVFWLLCLLV